MSASHSIKLQGIMRQITEILKRENIAGAIILHDMAMMQDRPEVAQGVTEYQLVVDPTWSAIETTHSPGSMRAVVRAHRKHYGNDPEKRDRIMAHTRNMVHMLAHQSGINCLMLGKLEEDLDDTHGKATHVDGSGPTTSLS